MKIIVDILHPAHVHFFKNIIWELEKQGYEFKIVIGIGRPEFTALPCIEMPCLIAVVHFLTAPGYGVGMAFHGAFQALFTKLL